MLDIMKIFVEWVNGGIDGRRYIEEIRDREPYFTNFSLIMRQ